MSKITPEKLRERANELVWEQRDARGWEKGKTIDGKPCLIIQGYHPTPETEARAAEILALRRRAAFMESVEPAA